MAFDLARLEAIFTEALSKADGEARAAFLNAACEDDTELLHRVKRLLVSHDTARSFMSAPATGLLAPFLLQEGPGARIGRYKLLQQIGEGGFGVVFMAEQEEPVRRKVALKVIKLGMDTRQVIARFEGERQALAMMDHPSIAKVLDGGATDSGRPYFVMELVRGVPITEYCDRKKLSIPQRLELFAQVCHAVHHAHQKGLIHRDLKPSNILVSTQDDQPAAKVIDFGIAKATAARLTERTLFTEFRQLVGTPEYMSPEQADGGLDIDTRSDIYSLGVLLYTLLTGTTPLDGSELLRKAFGEMQRIIREVDPPAPSTRLSTMGQRLTDVTAFRSTDAHHLGKFVRGDLDWIVMKCLEKDRRRRYESASGLATDIQRYLSHEPVSAAKPSALYRARKFVYRNKTPVLAAAAIVLAMLIGLIAATIGMVQASRQHAIAQTRFNDVRALANKFMLDFHARIENLPGSTPAVKMLVDTSLEYLNRLAAEAKDDPELLHDLMVAYAKIGDIQGNPQQNNLGDLTGALESYRRSFDIAQRLSASKADDGRASEWLLKLRWMIGDVQFEAGRSDDAFKSYTDGLSIAQRAAEASRGDAQSQQMLGLFHEKIGLVLENRGDIKGCLTAYRAAQAIYAKLVGEHPNDTEVQRAVAENESKIGYVLWSRGDPSHMPPGGRPYHKELHSRGNIDGDPASALVCYYKSLDICQQLAASDPTNSRAQRDLAKAQRRVGELLFDTNDLAGAAVMYAKSRQIVETLADADRQNVQLQWHLAAIWLDMAKLQSNLGDPAGALAGFRKHLQISQRILDLDKTNQKASEAVSASYMGMATEMNYMGDTEGAIANYRRCIELARQNIATNGKNPALPRALARAYVNLAAVLDDAGDKDGVAENFQKFLETARSVPLDAANRNFNWNIAIWAREAGSFHRERAADESRSIAQRAESLRQARSFYQESLNQLQRLKTLGIVTSDENGGGWSAEIAGEVHACDVVEAGVLAASTKPALATAPPASSPSAATRPTTPEDLEAMHQKAVVLVQQQRFTEALKVREQLVDRAVELLGGSGSSDPRLARYRVGLADLLVQRHRYSEAETQLLIARASIESSESGTERANAILAKLSDLYRAWGAAQPETSAGDTVGRDEAIRMLKAQSEIAFQLERENRMSEAEAMRVRGLAAARGALTADDPVILRHEVDLAEMLVSMKRYADAEHILLDVRQRAQKSDVDAEGRAVRGLLSLYDAWQNPEAIARRDQLLVQVPPLTILSARTTNRPDNWKFEVNGSAKAALIVDGGALMVPVTEIDSQSWHVQMFMVGLDFEEDREYTLTFEAKAAAPRDVFLLASREGDDYVNIGLNERCALGTEWKKYRFVITPRNPRKEKNRLGFVLGDATGTVWLRDLVLVESLTPKLPAQPEAASGSESLMKAGTASAFRKDWSSAVDAFNRALQMTPKDSDVLFNVALALSAAGKQDEYQQRCHELLSRLTTPTELREAGWGAKICLVLAPTNSDDLDRAGALADFVVAAPQTPGAIPWVRSTRALADYRRGRFESAIEWAARSMESEGAAPSCRAEDYFVQAMSFAELQQPDLARKSLASGEQLLAQAAVPTTVPTSGNGWRDTVVADQLHREAASLVNSQPPASQP